MNERIKLLAEQCWNERPEGQLHFDNEKFAELIVRECANVIHTRIGPKSALDVLEHFGVES
jgi:hypothetical protein